ncbi:MAG: adenylate/guanylate cyclase domain-containing protein [Elusimicrobia bacterium]|nr:adenylate/guanylate cyclase domain-containing protein [Elusimicrobiota bacterium]
MANTAKGSGNKKLYVGTAVFSVLWLLLSVVFNITDRLDYGWDHFIKNVPSILSWVTVFTSDQPDKDDTYGYRFAFGKYITKQANPKISIAALDELTLQQYGWPVPRKYYGTLVEKLNKYGAKGILFDVIMSRTNQDKEADIRPFVDAVARSNDVATIIFFDMETMEMKPAIKGLSEASSIIAQPHVEMTMDVDGQVRRYRPFYGVKTIVDDEVKFTSYAQAGLTKTRLGKDFQNLPIPSIGIAGYSFYSGKHLSQLFMDYRDDRILNYRNYVMSKLHPGWDKDPKNIYMSSYRHISFSDILSGRLSREEKEAIKGGIVLVGSTAVGAYDHVPAPFFKQFPGVEVHATFLDNAIAGDFLEKMNLLLVTLLVLGLPWVPLLLRKYSLPVLISVCLGILAVFGVGYIVLLANQVLMPFASISLALFLPFAYITVDKGLAEGREKKWIKGTFGQYLSPKVVELVTKDPSKLALGGEKRDMTAFFLDIAGFTTMSEKLAPEELTAMLTNYLSGLTEIILKHDGTVDKYIGDCIMAFWNAPLDQAEHRKLAILAAVDCQAEMTRLNEALTQYEIKPSCRVGVNSGPMVVGNMGSKTRLSYTIMGDSVNLASRLEGANKFFHSKIMTSEYTFEDIKEQFDYRFLGSIRVVGKAIPVKVYEPFARKGEAPADVQGMLKNYAAGIEKFYKGDYTGSVTDFKAALAARPGDGPSQYYIETAEAYAKAPPKDWDQSFNLTSKG